MAAATLLAGCASASIQQQDLTALGSAPTAEEVSKIAHGSPLSRLDYLVDGQTHSYEIYEAADTGKRYGLLFQAGRLSAVDVLDAHTYNPGPRICTFFPPKPSFDVEDCLRKITQTAKDTAVDLSQPVTPDQKAIERTQNEKAGAVAEGAVETALFAPIILPVAAVMLPFMGAEKASEKSAQQSLDVKLGEPYQDIQARVEQIPERMRSVTQGSGTVLVSSGLTSIPAAAFGLQDGKVIWLQFDPPATCGGGFMLWEKDCRIGDQGRIVLHLRSKTPPVIDEWENLAFYYSPPPKFEVIDVVSGKAQGFSAKSRIGNAVEGMKDSARKEGATGVLLDFKADSSGEKPTAMPPMGTGSPVYGAVSTMPMAFYAGWFRGWAIYVPADADAFQKASQAHKVTCDDLSQKKDDAKDAYKAIKDAGAPADIAAAQAKRQAAEDAADAAYCGDDDWYAEQMTGQKD